jgi:uroporphyrinogen decarboxylase
MWELDLVLGAEVDFVLTGGSGSVTMASPALWEKYSLPTLKEICRRCRDAGVPSMVHSCGRQRHMLETCAARTDLNCINPLEPPPMGDVTLRRARGIVAGTNLTPMGNLHTTDVMLLGSPDDVKAASREAISDAGRDGGFILSTGDQCGWATPDENLYAMVEAAQAYGTYGG